MTLRLLGPPEMLLDGGSVDLGGPRQRTVLCALALNANRVTLVGELIDIVWDEEPPSTARGQIQICISRLRKLFGPGRHPGEIQTRSSGYLLSIPPEHLDVAVFESQVTAARLLAVSGSRADAAAAYRDALALWRGPALAGVQSRTLARGATLLEDQRYSAVVQRIQLDLALGRHQEILGELRALAGDHPLSEPMHELLMLALYRSGRQAEAIDESRRVRELLVDELGIEPGESLRTLATAILNQDPSLDLDPPGPHRPPPGLPSPDPAGSAPVGPASGAFATLVPRQLPRSLPDLVGRDVEVEEIRQRLLGADDTPTRYAMPIVVVTGRGGVGKTSLAVRVAHEVEHLFPDGQLFAALGDADSEADTSAQSARFLGSLGVSGAALPDDLDSRAELYRTRLAGKRMLVVLDSAKSEEQVLPLLPGSDGCAVVITSTLRLDGLFGAHHVDIDVLSAATSLELLASVVGPERVAAEPEAAVKLVRFCDGLPLALRIAGARLASKPHWRVATLARRLSNQARRLDELSHRGVGLRSSIDLTYFGLRPALRRLFALGTLTGVPDFPAWTAAALMDTTLAAAEDMLESLVDARLLDTVRYPGGRVRYRYQNLIRDYAAEKLPETVSAGDRDAALTRLLGGWLALAEHAHRNDHGGDYSVLHGTAERWRPPSDPGGADEIEVSADWWETERHALVAAVRQAAAAGLHELCWDLALTSIGLFQVRGYFGDWRDTAEVGLAATTLANSDVGSAAMLYSLGSLHMSQYRLDDTEDCLGKALRLFHSVGHVHGCALVLRNWAIVDRFRGRRAAMIDKYERALPMMREVGDVVGEAHILQSLAQHFLDTERIEQAQQHLEAALVLCRGVGYRRGEAMVLNRFAELYLWRGRTELVHEALHRALLIVRGLGDRTGECYTLYGLGILRRHESRFSTAETTLLQAQALASAVGERMIEGRSLYALGETALDRDERQAASTHLNAAVAVFSATGSRLWHAKTLLVLSALRLTDGELDEARHDLDDADRLLAEVDGSEADQLRRHLGTALATLPVLSEQDPA